MLLFGQWLILVTILDWSMIDTGSCPSVDNGQLCKCLRTSVTISVFRSRWPPYASYNTSNASQDRPISGNLPTWLMASSTKWVTELQRKFFEDFMHFLDILKTFWLSDLRFMPIEILSHLDTWWTANPRQTNINSLLKNQKSNNSFNPFLVLERRFVDILY